MFVYAPDEKAWKAAASLPTPRTAHAAVPLADGRLAIIGGTKCGTENRQNSAIEIWNPKLDEWTTAGQLPETFRGAAAHRLTDGRVLILGGVARETYIWTPKTGTIKEGPPLTAPHTASGFFDGRVVALVTEQPSMRLGVDVLERGSWHRVVTAEKATATEPTTHPVQLRDGRLLFPPETLVDLRARKLATLSRPPDGLGQPEFVVLKGGKVFGVGGHGQSDHGRAAIWDPQGQEGGFWTALPGAPERDWELFAHLPDGRVMFRLENHRGAGPNRVALWNPRTGALKDTSPMGDNRAHAAALVTPAGEVIAVGGEDVRRALHSGYSRALDMRKADPSTLRTVEAWSPTTASWRTLAPLPEPREGTSAVLLRDGRILVGGGSQTFYEADSANDLFQGRGHISSKIFVYEPHANAWQVRPDLELGGYPILVQLADGRVMGLGPRCGTIDERLRSWEPVSCPNSAHSGGAFLALPGGGVAALGGTDASQAEPSAAAETWDPKTKQWTTLPPMNAGRYQAYAVAVRDGRIVVGGPPAFGIELWNPKTAEWSVNADLPAPVGRLLQGTSGDVIADTLNHDPNRMWRWLPTAPGTAPLSPDSGFP
jgi:hypothetical protein